jgi:hypothetical protein
MAANSHRPPEEDSPRHVGEPGMVGLDHPTVIPDSGDDEEDVDE